MECTLLNRDGSKGCRIKDDHHEKESCYPEAPPTQTIPVLDESYLSFDVCCVLSVDEAPYIVIQRLLMSVILSSDGR